jgi:hypothetical protein
MKTMKSICETTLETMKGEVRRVLCDYVMSPFGPHLMPEPFFNDQYVCGYCGGSEHWYPFNNPPKPERVWLCDNRVCDVNTKSRHAIGTLVAPMPTRAREWRLFCELNGIGDLHYDVKFEKIEQSEGKIDYLLKFANKPNGIIFMQGTYGAGKTYASMGVCELFTRKSTSAIFTTQKKMLDDWLDTFKKESVSNYKERVSTCSLLVIDDFGTGEPPPGFMGFLLELINTRIQWTDRGTIISTNLNDDKFSEYCGQALNDRIGTGQTFVFTNASRRQKVIL